MRILTLTHKTRKGKQKLNQFGNKWIVLRSVPDVCFSSFTGPWLFIKPIKDMSKIERQNAPRWIHKNNDKDFLITSDIKRYEIMKTKKQWDNSKENLETFLQPKDEIDEEFYWYFIEILPPIYQTSYGFLVGEPHSHNWLNEARYGAFIHNPTRTKFWFLGNLTVKQFRNTDYIAEITP